jgi:hypothetical protein
MLSKRLLHVNRSQLTVTRTCRHLFVVTNVPLPKGALPKPDPVDDYPPF